MNTSKLQLRDPDQQPSCNVIAGALGEANDAYLKLVSELESHGIRLEWRYYNDGKAWLAKGLHSRVGKRGGKSDKTVLWLSVWDGFFKVTFYVREKYRLDALTIPLDEKARQMMASSKQMGKLKYFPLTIDVCSNEFIESVMSVVAFMKDH